MPPPAGPGGRRAGLRARTYWKGERVSVRIVIAALIVTIGPVWVVTAHAAQEEHPGAAPYAQVCGMCHGERGTGDQGPPLVPGTFDPEYVLAVVREGFGQMPPISRRELTDDQIRQIVAYLATFDKPASDPAAHGPER